MPEGSQHPQWLRVAHIVRPQGRSGEVVAELLTDFPQRFTEHPAVQLRAPGAESPAENATVELSRLHAGRIVLKLAGCDSMEAAERLRGYDIVVGWAERMPLEEDAIYVAELAGASLLDTRSGQVVGTILDVDRATGGTPLLIVERADSGGELLAPFVKAYDPHWDPNTRTLAMALPKGLVALDSPALDSPALDSPALDSPALDSSALDSSEG